VSKLLVPEGYDFSRFFEPMSSWEHIKDHHKYFNNYEYQKAIFLINKIPHLDNGFSLLLKEQRLSSPLAVIYYDEYINVNDAEDYVKNHADEIQCVVSVASQVAGFPAVMPGQAQNPSPADYADGIDTMEFLLQLGKKL
jgi:hypothetical protein